jgi:hypothetical protein
MKIVDGNSCFWRSDNRQNNVHYRNFVLLGHDNVTLSPPQDFWIIHEGHAVLESPIYNGPFTETNTTFGLDSTAFFSVATAGFQVYLFSKQPDTYQFNIDFVALIKSDAS